MYREPCFDPSREEIRDARERNPRQTSCAELAAALAKLGVKPGMQVVVHSSLASLGEFEGGAGGVCNGLMKCLTGSGSLLMPGLTRYPGSGEEYCYDVLNTPVGVGAIPEYFRKMPGVVRSWDPTHSFCAWGRDKEYFVREHHRVPTMHRESPLGRLEQAGGYCLMIGCKKTVTFMHVVEMSRRVPCLGARTEAYCGVLPDGRRVDLRGWSWRATPCRADDFDIMYQYMREQDTLAELMLGMCHMRFFKLADFREAYEKRLSDPVTGCAGCPSRPRQVRQSVGSDWDAEQDCVLADTNAFVG